MLRLDAVEAGYDGSPVVFGVSLVVGAGQAVALLGRNGMGKTTTIRTIVGALRPTAGSVQVAGVGVAGLAAHRICQLGVGYVPEGRRIFKHLTVQEQLSAFAYRARGRRAWRIAEIFDLFPALVTRRRSPGGLLSGGEQQMLAIGRALMTAPSLLILDEATEGLAPMVRRQIWTVLGALKRDGLAILIVDKNLTDVLALADSITVLEKGRVAWCGEAASFGVETQRRLLSV
jgi:branched-chain amino acid transport system ATP-binding protein